MSEPENSDALRSTAKRSLPTLRAPLLATTLAGLMAASGPANAVDGCLVLLCFAAPDWHAIPKCVPPIHQVLRDLARGHAFPTCAMSGAGNAASHRWARAPAYCPPQYIRIDYGESAPIYSCEYAGAVSVNIGGRLWSRTWWRAGNTVTEFTPTAKAKLGAWNTRYDDDYAAWLTSLPPPLPSCPYC